MLCSEKLDAQLVLLSEYLGLVALDEHLERLLEQFEIETVELCVGNRKISLIISAYYLL